jgi:hypothetical protein
MRSSHSLDRLDVAFDDDRLVADAGLLRSAPLARQLGLKELVEEHLDLGAAVGRANAGDKLCTLVIRPLPVAIASTTRTPCGTLAPPGSWASRPRPRPP